MNVENIKKVRDVIAGLKPGRFSMEKWACRPGAEGQRWYVGSAQELLHDCGTCACIGGWTNAILAPTSRLADGGSAKNLLGLDHRAANRLFYVEDADGNCAFAWDDITPAHAVRVLDHLLETGEVDWKGTRRARKAVAK